MICIRLERFFELPIIPAPEAELEAALRDVDESVFAERLLGARSPSALRFTRL